MAGLYIIYYHSQSLSQDAWLPLSETKSLTISPALIMLLWIAASSCPSMVRKNEQPNSQKNIPTNYQPKCGKCDTTKDTTVALTITCPKSARPNESDVADACSTSGGRGLVGAGGIHVAGAGSCSACIKVCGKQLQQQV
jgi:hypothetical protein